MVDYLSPIIVVVTSFCVLLQCKLFSQFTTKYKLYNSYIQ
jgi:hypothetical protein